MKVFNCMDRLERLPVLEPDDLCLFSSLNLSSPVRTSNLISRHPRPKLPRHIIIDLLPRLRRQIIRGRIIFQLELGPHNKMHNALLDPIRPVIVQDPDVLCRKLCQNSRFTLRYGETNHRTRTAVPWASDLLHVHHPSGAAP